MNGYWRLRTRPFRNRRLNCVQPNPGGPQYWRHRGFHLEDLQLGLIADSCARMSMLTRYVAATVLSKIDVLCTNVLTIVIKCSKLAGASTLSNHFAMPIGYNSRTFSVVVGSTPIRRLHDMICDRTTNKVAFQAQMDYDIEIEVSVPRKSGGSEREIGYMLKLALGNLSADKATLLTSHQIFVNFAGHLVRWLRIWRRLVAA